MWVCLGISRGNGIINHWMECLSLFSTEPIWLVKIGQPGRFSPLRTIYVDHRSFVVIPCNTSFEVWGGKLSAKNMMIKPMVVPPDFFPCNQPTDPPNINLHPACGIVAILRLLMLQHLESFQKVLSKGASLLLISSSMHFESSFKSDHF